MPAIHLGLTLLVKDEAHTIEKTLESCAETCDFFAAYDTGSTDGTQDVLRAWRSRGRRMVDLSSGGSTLREGPFENYAHARNRALVLAQAVAPPRTCAYALSLSADETLIGGEALRTFLESYEEEEEAFLVEIRTTGGLFDYPRVLRLGGAWRYVGEIHEVPQHRMDPERQPTLKIPDCRIEYAPTDPERHAKRLQERDLPGLTRMRIQAKTESDRVRATLLLAQTYEALAAIRGSKVTTFEDKLEATLHQSQAFGLYLLLAQTSDDPNLRFKYLNAADVLGIYSSPEMLLRLRPIAQVHPEDPAVAYMVAVHTANVDARAGLGAARRAAEVAEAAVVDKNHPYDPHGLLWRPHLVAAMCAKAIGEKTAAREHAIQGLRWNGPESSFQEFRDETPQTMAR